MHIQRNNLLAWDIFWDASGSHLVFQGAVWCAQYVIVWAVALGLVHILISKLCQYLLIFFFWRNHFLARERFRASFIHIFQSKISWVLSYLFVSSFDFSTHAFWNDQLFSEPRWKELFALSPRSLIIGSCRGDNLLEINWALAYLGTNFLGPNILLALIRILKMNLLARRYSKALVNRQMMVL